MRVGIGDGLGGWRCQIAVALPWPRIAYPQDRGATSIARQIQVYPRNLGGNCRSAQSKDTSVVYPRICGAIVLHEWVFLALSGTECISRLRQVWGNGQMAGGGIPAVLGTPHKGRGAPRWPR